MYSDYPTRRSRNCTASKYLLLASYIEVRHCGSAAVRHLMFWKVIKKVEKTVVTGKQGTKLSTQLYSELTGDEE